MSKVKERVRQKQSTRLIQLIEEAEEHGFDNTGTGKKNISGIYQWVNKVYEAQIFNYGQRLLFDLSVPEPAAFFFDVMAGKPKNSLGARPPPFEVVVVNDVNVRALAADDLGADGSLKPGIVTRSVTPADLTDSE